MVDRHAVALGCRSVEVKGKKLHYKTLQMTDDSCTCRYVYEGNVKNPRIKMSGVDAVSDFVQSFYGKCNAESEHHFHQIVGSRYDKPTNQAIPWHSDQSDLLSPNTDIVSVSLGCAGAFCYMPNEKAQFSDFHKSLKLGGQWLKRRQVAIDRGLRGCVPLFAGDVLLMCGSFQECMQHKTLPLRPSGGACSEALSVSSIVGDVMARYPGTTAERFAWLPKAVEQGLTAGGEDRGVLTFRRIAHHYDGSNSTTRCPSLPARCAPGAALISKISPLSCMPGSSSSHDVATVLGTLAADVYSEGEYSVASESVDSEDVTAAGLPSKMDAARAGAAENELEAVVGRVNAVVAAYPPSCGAGPVSQRAPSHPLPYIVNVMISPNDFIQYLGRLEGDLERIHSTTPLEQRERVRQALDTLMSKAAAFYRQKHIADIKSESDMRLAELHTFSGSKAAFMPLRQPLNEDKLEPHTRTPACCFRLVSLGWI